MLFSSSPYAHAYRVEKKSEVLSKASLEMSIGIVLLLVFLVLDFQFRDQFEANLTRVPALLFAGAFLLIKHLIQPKTRDWVLPLYYAFLFSLTFMQFMLLFMDFGTETFYPTLIESMMILFLVGMIMRAGWLAALGVQLVPALIFYIMASTRLMIQDGDVFLLMIPAVFVIIALVVNHLTERLRLERFVALELLRLEKEK